MARTAATLGDEALLTDYMSLGVITGAFPEKPIRTALAETGRSSFRERELPAHVVMYYVIAQALFMQISQREVLRCLLEGVRWLFGAKVPIKVTGKSGSSQAGSRLGWEPVKQLHDEVVKPIAVKQTRGVWCQNWKLVNLDGNSLDVADTQENRAAFDRPGASRGRSACPQIRFVSLAENGTHVLFGTEIAEYAIGEFTLAKAALKRMQPGMVYWADRNFLGCQLWQPAQAIGADLLWREKKRLRLERKAELPDGSYLSHIYPSERNWRRKTNGIRVRVIEYRLESVPEAEPSYRLVSTILDYEAAPAEELAALYHERREIETALDELKTQWCSNTPDLAMQKFYGFMMAHFAVRGLMHEAALNADKGPDQLSFPHAERVIWRKPPPFGAIPLSPEIHLSSSCT